VSSGLLQDRQIRLKAELEVPLYGSRPGCASSFLLDLVVYRSGLPTAQEGTPPRVIRRGAMQRCIREGRWLLLHRLVQRDCFRLCRYSGGSSAQRQGNGSRSTHLLPLVPSLSGLFLPPLAHLPTDLRPGLVPAARYRQCCASPTSD